MTDKQRDKLYRRTSALWLALYRASQTVAPGDKSSLNLALDGIEQAMVNLHAPGCHCGCNER